MSCCQEILGNLARLTAFPATVRSLDQDTGATGSLTGLDIAPPIADHHTARQIDLPPLCRLQQQPWLGLAAFAPIGIVVVAGEYILNRQRASDPCIDALYTLTTLAATHHIRLIGDDDQHIAGCPQHLACFSDAREYLAFFESSGGMGNAVSHDRPVEHTVPVQKDGCPHRTDSHFVSYALRCGCETRRCQMTA